MKLRSRKINHRPLAKPNKRIKLDEKRVDDIVHRCQLLMASAGAQNCTASESIQFLTQAIRLAKHIRHASLTDSFKRAVIAMYRRRGTHYFEQRQYVKAERDYTTWITYIERFDAHEYLSRAYYNRANTRKMMGRYDDALVDYNRTLELHPQHVDARNNRGNMYADMKDDDKALEDFNEIIRMDPKYVNAYYNRGNMYRRRNMHQDAIRDYTMAIQLCPKYADAYFNRAICFREMKQSINCTRDFLKASTVYTNIFDKQNCIHEATVAAQEAQQADQDAWNARQRLAESNQVSASSPSPNPSSNDVKSVPDCTICMVNKADHVVLNCMHVCFCEECARLYDSFLLLRNDPEIRHLCPLPDKTCPKCRGSIESIRKLFL
jgi:tetratricopeptide (TPR) repeat protein